MIQRILAGTLLAVFGTIAVAGTPSAPSAAARAPTVLVRGSIAMVWAPSEFWIDGKTSHCGVDVFSFIKVGEAWHVANSMWTVEPDACPELRPSDPASLRPLG